MKNPFRVDKHKGVVKLFSPVPYTALPVANGVLDRGLVVVLLDHLLQAQASTDDLVTRIFEELDKIIISGYPYKRFHPRKYNMLKKKYL